MKNKLYIFIILLLIIIITYFTTNKPEKNHEKIAIVTTLSHPALDLVRKGFEQQIKSHIHDDYELVFFNAEGSLQSANLIARQIAHDENFISILAIASLATQTLAKTIHDKPIVIAAVSDPSALLPENTHNICGLSDAIDADFQVITILDLLPQTKTISLLYSPHETNSSVVVQKLKQSIEKHNLTVELVGVYEPQQIPSASRKACKNDVVLIPLDNQLAASMPAVIKATNDLSCAIILTDKALLKYGAAFAFGIDYEKSGEQAADIMLKILKEGVQPKTLGIVTSEDSSVYINKNSIKKRAIIINPNSKSLLIPHGEL